MPRYSPQARRLARRLALQATYQWQVVGGDVATLVRQYRAYSEAAGADLDHFERILRIVLHESDALDKIFLPFLEHSLSRVDPIELALLRLAVAEMRQGDVPVRVVIDEAIEIVKEFGAQNSYRFINGVLHQVAVARASAPDSSVPEVD